MANQVPVPLVLLVCDGVHQDPSTGKTTLNGTFQNIAAAEFPCAHPKLVVFAELTDGRGDTPLTLKFVRVTPDSIDGEVLHEVGLNMNFPDPRAIASLNLTLKNVHLPSPGEYRFILECAGTLVIERRVVALKSGGTKS